MINSQRTEVPERRQRCRSNVKKCESILQDRWPFGVGVGPGRPALLEVPASPIKLDTASSFTISIDAAANTSPVSVPIKRALIRNVLTKSETEPKTIEST